MILSCGEAFWGPRCRGIDMGVSFCTLASHSGQVVIDENLFLSAINSATKSFTNRDF